jgi:hypothetical protein
MPSPFAALKGNPGRDDLLRVTGLGCRVTFDGAPRAYAFVFCRKKQMLRAVYPERLRSIMNRG